MLDRQAQAAWTGRTEHQPIGAFGKILIGQSVAEHFVVGAEIIDVDPRFWDAGSAACFKDIDRFVGKGAWHPTAYRTAPKPFIFKQPELLQVVEALDFLARIEA